jgi:ribosomal protein S18 acetylase RimI-like enzyme
MAGAAIEWGMALDIRLLTETDWIAYRDLRLAALRAEPEAFGSTAEHEESLGDTWFQQTLRSNFVFAAFRDAAICGLAAWRRNGIGKLAHVGTIWGMYVAPAERGRGTGRALLDAVVAHAAAQAVEALKLSVTATNAAAMALYDRCGFVAYGLEPGTLKVGEHYYDTELRIRWLIARPSQPPRQPS